MCPAHRLARERIREKYLQQDEVEMVEAWDFLDQELLPVDLLVIVSVEISLESHIVPPHAPPHLLHLLVSLVLRRLALQRLGALLLVQVQWCRDGCECTAGCSATGARTLRCMKMCAGRCFGRRAPCGGGLTGERGWRLRGRTDVRSLGATHTH